MVFQDYALWPHLRMREKIAFALRRQRLGGAQARERTMAMLDRVGVLERGRLVQTSTPEEIYASPASPFVARFTGLAGELAVRVFGTGADGSVEVEPKPVDGQGTAAGRLDPDGCHVFPATSPG
jgi:ABC-type Fe3+/spermidine/putrescine transport system ATPase subunit